MRVWKTFSVLLMLTLSIAVILLSACQAVAWFSIPDVSHFSFGQFTTDQPGTVTKVEKTISPFGGFSAGSSFPFGGLSPFYRPYTSQQSYTKTILTPDGPKTRIVDHAYDGNTGERITTITNA